MNIYRAPYKRLKSRHPIWAIKNTTDKQVYGNRYMEEKLARW